MYNRSKWLRCPLVNYYHLKNEHEDGDPNPFPVAVNDVNSLHATHNDHPFHRRRHGNPRLQDAVGHADHIGVALHLQDRHGLHDFYEDHDEHTHADGDDDHHENDVILTHTLGNIARHPVSIGLAIRHKVPPTLSHTIGQSLIFGICATIQVRAAYTDRHAKHGVVQDTDRDAHGHPVRTAIQDTDADADTFQNPSPISHTHC